MSIRIEQYRSLQMTRAFLRDLLAPSATPRVPFSVRQRASYCLRHYPFLDKNGAPLFSPDNLMLEPDAKSEKEELRSHHQAGA